MFKNLKFFFYNNKINNIKGKGFFLRFIKICFYELNLFYYCWMLYFLFLVLILFYYFMGKIINKCFNIN